MAAVTITEIQGLHYPSVIQNTNKSSKVVLTWKGTLGGSTNVELVDQFYHQAKFRVTSNGTSPISINVTSLGNEAKVSLRGFKIRYKNKTYKKFPVTGLDNPGLTGEEIWLGAQVKAGKRAKPGLKRPEYLLEINDD